MLIGFPNYHAFSKRPTYQALAGRLSPEELAEQLAKPDVRDAILAEDDLPADPRCSSTA